MRPQHLKGHTYHKRLGRTENAFRYGVDYVLVDPEEIHKSPWLFSHNKTNVLSLYDCDNGGIRGKGLGVDWVRDTLANADLVPLVDMHILLLTQPRVFGHVFNPVSFWLVFDQNEDLRCVIAEVNNTFGDRHTYICTGEDLRTIESSQTIVAKKHFYVSPFQPVDGDYRFTFDVSETQIKIRIELRHGEGGILATLTGSLQPLTSFGIVSASLFRPLGSIRVLALIHFQAAKLWIKGAKYLSYSKSAKIEASK